MAVQRTEPETGDSPPASEPSGARRGGASNIFEGATAGIAIAAVVSAIFIWWAWKDGAYFGNVFFPGAIVVYALLLVLLIGAPFAARLDGPARVALIAICALAAWTLLSIFWTDSHRGAVQDGERALLYAAVFALGLWCCRLGDRGRRAPLAVMAVTGGAIGVVVTLTLASGGNITDYFHDDATLRFPIGYRNAEAAFLLICLWPTIALAAEGRLAWWLRSLLVASATILLELVVLAQSRGSLPAAAVALLVFIVVSPHRLRAAVYLGLAAIPLLPAIPTLLDVFQHGKYAGLEPFMRDSARVIVYTSLASFAFAAICIRVIGDRLRLSAEHERWLSWGLATVAVVVVAVGTSVFVSRHGGPVGFLDQKVSEFGKLGYPNLSGQGARFGANVGSNRHDFWKVAWEEAKDQPIAGGGAGSWQFAYLRDRGSGESPKDPHSVEFLFMSELGFVGMALFVAFVVAAVLAALRTRRVGSGAAMLAAGALTSGAYLLVHASYDWFWHYPAVTAPVIFLLGAAAAPGLTAAAGGLGDWRRWVAVGAVAFALLLAVPLFLAERYADRAYDAYPADPAGAISDLDRAADLDPYDPQPLYAKGVIESKGGRTADAAATFREAIDREPVNYAGHYFLARELVKSDPGQARAEVSEAMRLNPFDLRSRALARRLGLKPKKIQVG